MAVRKVPVESLELGMYVSELDRPWIESPFMFQGFTIESESDLAAIREACKFVYVDDEQHDDDEDKTIALRMTSGRKTEAEPGDPTAPPGLAKTEVEKVQSNLKEASEVRDRARRYVVEMLRDVRLGDSVRPEKAREVVNDLVERIYEDANTLLWLTNLKKQSEYTANHCLNVCILALAFGAHLGFSRQHLHTLGLGALMHDIGKMKTPPEILNKPARLTPDEFDVIKNHPVDGFEILRATNEVSQPVLEIVRGHHERVSGRGYPDGLRGEQISTAVLVVAICDVYDAITSDRCYHHGIPPHEGLSAMYQLAPTEFGRELMQEFIKCIGIYPVGSLVELENGALGIVVSNDPRHRLRPVVMLVRDAYGQLYSPRRYVSLSSLADAPESRKWMVRRVVDPKHFGLDLQKILASEMVAGRDTAVYHI